MVNAEQLIERALNSSTEAKLNVANIAARLDKMQNELDSFEADLRKSKDSALKGVAKEISKAAAALEDASDAISDL